MELRGRTNHFAMKFIKSMKHLCPADPSHQVIVGYFIRWVVVRYLQFVCFPQGLMPNLDLFLLLSFQIFPSFHLHLSCQNHYHLKSLCQNHLILLRMIHSSSSFSFCVISQISVLFLPFWIYLLSLVEQEQNRIQHMGHKVG